MKLAKARIREYKSIWDSNEFSVEDITCLVGKNEAGKTAILQALYRLNPIIPNENEFDVTNDYPRAEVSDYEEMVADNEREPAKVIEGTFILEDDDIASAEAVFGPQLFTSRELLIHRYYSDPQNEKFSTKTFNLSLNSEEALTYLFEQASITEDQRNELISLKYKPIDIASTLQSLEQTEEVQRLYQIIVGINQNGFRSYIYSNYIREQVPKFLYFDEYYQMKGRENLETLDKRKSENRLEHSDYPMLGLIGLARLDLNDLLNPDSTQELVNKLEGAGNRLSRKVLKYWSQNQHIHMQFDVRPAHRDDPEGMKSGTNIWANVHDSRHMVSTNLGTRSRGFVWFFSFLAWYSLVEKENKGQNVILLLDEPGLFLHGKAQGDLLEYLETELKPKHQIVYTTHSPFMVDSSKFNRIRIVQDKGIDQTQKLPKEEDGTKIFTDVLEAFDDSLFPLQGALGYEITQTLFIGKNCLIVEGVSDLIYLKTFSSVLGRLGRTELSEDWTITPVGGSDKVPTFVALLGSQRDLFIATLTDFQKKDAQVIENLYKKKLLEKKNVFTFTDFTPKSESDIEDMMDEDFYLDLFNMEYSKELKKPIKVEDIKSKHPRILVKIEATLRKSKESFETFSHYRPARYLVENISSMEGKISEDTLDRFEQIFKSLNGLVN